MSDSRPLSEELDTWHESVIICPWCGHHFSDSWEYGRNEGGKNIECQVCEKPIRLVVNVSITYTTTRR
jgi:hypothetical protein